MRRKLSVDLYTDIAIIPAAADKACFNLVVVNIGFIVGIKQNVTEYTVFSEHILTFKVCARGPFMNYG